MSRAITERTHWVLDALATRGPLTVADLLGGVAGSGPEALTLRQLLTRLRARGLVTSHVVDERWGTLAYAISPAGCVELALGGRARLSARQRLVLRMLPATTAVLADMGLAQATTRDREASALAHDLTRMERAGLVRAAELEPTRGGRTWRWERTDAGDLEVARRGVA